MIFRAACLLSAVLASAVPAVFAAPPADKVVVVDLKPSAGKLETLLVSEIAKAKAQHRTPFVEFGATWCGPCKSLKAALGDPLMIDAFAGTYVIRLDVDEWKGQTGPLGFDTKAIPVFYAVNDSGKPKGPKIDGGAWGEDIPANMAPPLKKFFTANGAMRK